MLARSRHWDGREVDASCDGRVLEQDALRLGAVDRGVADHDLESESILEGDKTARDLLRRRAEIEVASPGADFQERLVQHRLTIEVGRGEHPEGAARSGECIELVKEPTLLIVGATGNAETNREA